MNIAAFIQAVLLASGLLTPIALPPDVPVIPIVQNETQPDHYYRVAKETLDGIGAGGYTLLIDAPWDDSWGITNLRTREISISTTAPEDYVPSIALHEYAHVLQSESGVTTDTDALEVEADQYACAHGATWVHYIGSCT